MIGLRNVSSRARGLLAALLPALWLCATGCEGIGGGIMLGNPLLARMASASEETANTYPPEAQYRWAYDRFEIESADFRRGIRWRDDLKIVNAAGRLLRHLCRMHALLDPKDAKARSAALEAMDHTIALAETLAAGGGYRGGLEAAEDLEARIRENLHPSRVRVVARQEGTEAKPEPGPAGPERIVARRESVEERADGPRTRYFLVLEGPGQTEREVEVCREAFEAAEVGALWREEGEGNGE